MNIERERYELDYAEGCKRWRLDGESRLVLGVMVIGFLLVLMVA